MPSILDDFLHSLTTSKIFKDRDKLRPDYIPEELPHRERQISMLARILIAPIVRGARPSNVFIYGYTGTGKTAVTKYVLKWINSKFSSGENCPLKVIAIMINCKNEDTEYRVLRSLNEALMVKVPFTGLPVSELYRRFLRALDSEPRLLIIALDEIDHLVKKSGDRILYSLTRINSELSNSKVSLIGITNDLRLMNYLDPRVRSSLGEEEIVFPPYKAYELENILRQRAELAFYPEVLESGVIPLCASLAAREHGDARRALDLLRVAGELAERRGSNIVREEDVRKALTEIERDKAVEVIRTLPLHSKIVLFSIYILRNKPGGATTGEVYDVYSKLSKYMGFEPVSQRRVSDIISELDMVGLVQARLLSRGRYGRTKYTRLSISEEILNRGVAEDPLFRGLDLKQSINIRR